MTNTLNSTRKTSRLRSQSPVSRKTTSPRKNNGNGNSRAANGNGNRNGRVTNKHNGHGQKVASNGKGATRSTANNGKTAVVEAPSLTPREQLQQERDQVFAELKRLKAEMLETPELTGDEVDLSVYDREKTLGLVTAFERRLEKLENALQAAVKGQYGSCQNCGKQIDPERLKIFPETRHCITCKIAAEQQAKRRMLQYK